MKWVENNEYGYVKSRECGYLTIKEIYNLFEQMCQLSTDISSQTQKEYEELLVYSLSEGKTNKKKNKKKSNYNPLTPIAKVAIKAGIKLPNNMDGSIYEKHHKIQMLLPDGKLYEGIIRISNHAVDLGTWYNENKGCNFGISIVIDNQKRQNYDKSIPNNVYVTVYEYILKSGSEKSDSILMGIADDISKLRKREKIWDINTSIGIIPSPKYPSKGNPKPQETIEEKIERVVVEQVNKFLKSL